MYNELKSLHESAGGELSHQQLAAHVERYKVCLLAACVRNGHGDSVGQKLPISYQINWSLTDISEGEAQYLADEVRNQLNAHQVQCSASLT